MRALILVLLLIPISANSANIMVIDGGLEPEYRAILHSNNRILRESCYSLGGQARRSEVTDFNNQQFSLIYKYLGASLCQDKNEVQHGVGSSLLRTWQPSIDDHLLGAVGKGSYPDVGVPIQTNSHQTVIAGTITAKTSAGVRQWHAHNEVVFGLNALGEVDYANYNTLVQQGAVSKTVEALGELAEGFQGLFGVKVVSISQFVDKPANNPNISDRYTAPCDTHPDVTRTGILNDYARHVKTLRDRGVIVVVATDNSVIYPSNNGSLVRDNDKIPFPACLSTTVAVGGLSNAGAAQGALGPGIDYIENYHTQHPISNIEKIGTSYATPKVASYLAELLTINPSLTQYQALNALRNTGSLHCGSRQYGNVTKQYCIVTPNFAAAKNSVRDSIWSDLVALYNNYKDETKYGWNYGTSNHQNGLLSYFETVQVPQNKTLKVGDPVLRFSLRPYDVDTTDEIEVLVNDRAYGYLATTGSNRLGSTQTVCIPSSDLKSDGSYNEVKLKLKNSGETWGVTDLKIEVGVEDSTCLKATDPLPPLEENDDRIAGQSDPAGNAYGEAKVSSVPFQFDFKSSNSEIPTPSNYDTAEVRRDLRIKFTAKGGEASSTDNGTIVTVNTRQVLITPYIFGDEQDYEIIVNRSYFKNGSNQIEFKPRENLSNSVWGIRNISIEYIEPLALSIDTLDGSEYGDSQTPSRYAGLRANFNLNAVTNDHEFSVTGWDIDTATETRVFINGNDLGYLDEGSNQSYNTGSSFLLPKALLKVGENQIELVQKRPSSDYFGGSAEPWAVKDLKVSLLRPDLLPFNVRIVETHLSPSKPFTLSAMISNVGVGSSDGAVLNYYRSANATIAPTDALIGSSAIGGLAAGASVTVDDQFQTLLVNQGYYIGVCISNVANESVTGNNCSEGVEMNSRPITSPIMLLLLDE